MKSTVLGMDLRPFPQDDPKVKKPDITRAKEILGWDPEVGLREGLENTIEYFAKNDIDRNEGV